MQLVDRERRRLAPDRSRHARQAAHDRGVTAASRSAPAITGCRRRLLGHLVRRGRASSARSAARARRGRARPATSPTWPRGPLSPTTATAACSNSSSTRLTFPRPPPADRRRHYQQRRRGRSVMRLPLKFAHHARGYGEALDTRPSESRAPARAVAVYRRRSPAREARRGRRGPFAGRAQPGKYSTGLRRTARHNVRWEGEYGQSDRLGPGGVHRRPLGPPGTSGGPG